MASAVMMAFSVPVLALSIRLSRWEGMSDNEGYECSRGAWRDREESPAFLISIGHTSGINRGVCQVDSWHRITSPAVGRAPRH
jgi:hypothetical protein